MPKPVVAIVGRPNVGKSSLFNRLIGRRQAIVFDQPGITRDRSYGDVRWSDRVFTIVDTGGFVTGTEDTLSDSIMENIHAAIEEADVMLFLTDGLDGPTAVEHEVADYLRKSSKPVILTVNKADNVSRLELVYPFYEFGFEHVIGVSAMHGLQTGDLLDIIVDVLPPREPEERDPARDAIPVTIIGRPNVGKSTLLNNLLGKNRAVVDSTPGTTRDPVDILKIVDGTKYLFVDTAGIRRRGKIERGAEWVSVLRAEQSLERSKVALLVLDTIEGPVEGDAHVFGLAQKMSKACIILANKWDAIEKSNETAGEMAKRIRERIKFLPYAPIVLISAKTGQRVPKIYALINEVYENYRRQIPKDDLEELLREAIDKHPPPAVNGKPVYLRNLVQARTAPPTFVFETNKPKDIHFSYQRYLTNLFYERFELTGTPIVIRFKQRKKHRPGAVR